MFLRNLLRLLLDENLSNILFLYMNVDEGIILFHSHFLLSIWPHSNVRLLVERTVGLGCIAIVAGAVDHQVNFICALKTAVTNLRVWRKNAKKRKPNLLGKIQERKFHQLITFLYLDSHPIHHVLIASLWTSCVNMQG